MSTVEKRINEVRELARPKGVSLAAALAGASVAQAKPVILLGFSYWFQKKAEGQTGPDVIAGGRIRLGVNADDPSNREFGMQVHDVRMQGDPEELVGQVRMLREGTFPGWFEAVEVTKQSFGSLQISLRVTKYLCPLMAEMLGPDGAVIHG